MGASPTGTRTISASIHASDLTPDFGQTLRLARDGRSEALGKLLEQWRPLLLQLAQESLPAELRAKGGPSDVVQETFLEAQRDFLKFAGESPGDWRGWLQRILLNNLADFVRRFRDAEVRSVAQEVSLGSHGRGLAASLPGQTSSPSAQALESERAQQIEAALARLPEEYRNVIAWRHGGSERFGQIAERLGLSEDGARKLWLRAIQKLRAELGA